MIEAVGPGNASSNQVLQYVYLVDLLQKNVTRKIDSSHFVFKMAPLRTLAALALSVVAVSGFAPANNFATKQATRYDVFEL